MEPDIRALLQEILEVSKDNNRRLRKIHRASLWGTFFRIVWWIVILGIPVLLYYYFFQPYMERLLDAYQGVQSGAERFQNLNLPAGWQEALQKLGIDPNKLKQ